MNELGRKYITAFLHIWSQVFYLEGFKYWGVTQGIKNVKEKLKMRMVETEILRMAWFEWLMQTKAPTASSTRLPFPVLLLHIQSCSVDKDLLHNTSSGVWGGKPH